MADENGLPTTKTRKRRGKLGVIFSGFTPLGLGVFFVTACAASAAVVTVLVFFGTMILRR